VTLFGIAKLKLPFTCAALGIRWVVIEAVALREGSQ
jgi:hypothetical protein